MTTPLPNSPVDQAALLKYLDDCGFQATTINHPPLFTVGESQELRGKLEGGHTKNLFLKDKKGNHFLLTAQEDSVVNLKSLHRLLGGTGRLSFGNAEKMQAYLGVTPGAVTAFGVINDRQDSVKFALDQRLLKHEKINCHPLSNESTTTLLVDDLLAFAKSCGHDPMIVDLDTEI